MPMFVLARAEHIPDAPEGVKQLPFKSQDYQVT